MRPTLLNIPGITAVRHRAQLRDSELAKATAGARPRLALVSQEHAT